jgi:hypothetical protein
VVAVEHDEHEMLAALMATGPMSVPVLADLVRRPGWMRDAACREHPSVTWHPDRGEPTEPAKAICRGCLVRVQCLAYALD